MICFIAGAFLCDTIAAMLHITTDESLAQFVSSLPTSPPLVLVGEMHGSQQNAPFMQKIGSLLLERYDKITHAFEWPLHQHELDTLRAYIQDGVHPERLPAFFLDSDGRFTEQHVSLLRWMHNANKKALKASDIYIFDSTTFRRSHVVEKEMADSLFTYHNTHPQRCLLVETGIIHAQCAASHDGVATPMGAFLKEMSNNVVSIFLRYEQGTINVEGKPRDVTQARAQISGPESGFDAVYTFARSTATKDIRDLTKIADMF